MEGRSHSCGKNFSRGTVELEIEEAGPIFQRRSLLTVAAVAAPPWPRKFAANGLQERAINGWRASKPGSRGLPVNKIPDIVARRTAAEYNGELGFHRRPGNGRGRVPMNGRRPGDN